MASSHSQHMKAVGHKMLQHSNPRPITLLADVTYQNNSLLQVAASNMSFTLADITTWPQWQLTVYVTVITCVIPVILSLISSVAVTGNAAVIWVITRRQEMRTPVNIFLLNLAVSDIIFAAVALPLVIYRYAASTWQGGEFLCRFHTYVIRTAINVSVYTMAAIAVFRCVTIMRGTMISVKQQRVIARRVITCIAIIWIVMLTANSPVLFLYRVKTYSDEYAYCGLDYGREIYINFFITAYILPISVAVTCYSIIIHYLCRTQRAASTLTSKISHARKVRVTRLLIIVLLTFTLCWLPLHVQLIMVISGHQVSQFHHELMRLSTFCLSYTSTALNPLIYNFASAEFRTSFRNLLISINCFCCRRQGLVTGDT
jgi:hypothetical protein